MACTGLHCACCSGGAAVPPIAFAYACGAAWVAGHLVEVAVTSAVCGALAVAAVVALMRRQDRRQAARAARCSLFVTRPDALPGPGRPAIAPAVVNLNFYGMAPDERAAIIRAAIDLPPG